ncbi:MAG: hypothetical protein HQ549_00690 [Candidatus Omnitrophica bacterium]|nr:hypothetical protein [Candidatus Omnitrophota bacterium]
MGIKTRYQLKLKQKAKRKKKRLKLTKKGKNPDEHFYSGFNVFRPLK